MTGVETATLASVVGNILLALFGAWQKSRKDDAEAKLGTVSEAMATIEKAINDNKSLLDSTGAGDKIASTIASYGTAAKTSVDVARLLAKAVNDQIGQAKRDAYVAAIAAQEAVARAERVAQLAKDDADAAAVTPE
jgi:hypothetical protein